MGCNGLSALKLGLLISNEGGSLMCYGDGATNSKKMGMHEECLEKGKEMHKGCLERDMGRM